MSNPLHNTGILRLTQLLNALFVQQARDVASRLTLDSVADGVVPDLTPWIGAIAGAVKPLLLQTFNAGRLAAQRRIAEKLGRVPVGAGDVRRFTPDMGLKRLGEGVMRNEELQLRRPQVEGHHLSSSRQFQHVARAAASKSVVPGSQFDRYGRPQVSLSFSLHNPRAIDAVDAAAMAFCRETTETATRELSVALSDLRTLLKRGLERGDAVAYLAGKVREIFASPQRATMIAQTETFRALNGGQYLAAKDSGIAQMKEWVASSDACAGCLEIADRGEIPLDEPFFVDAKGGPYAICSFPPLHPFCQCTWNPVL